MDEASPGAVVMSRRSFAKFGAAVAAAAAMGTLGTYAFFTGTDRKENQVSVADNLNVKVVEPAWDPEASKNVVPGQHVPKDPRIRNLHDAIDGYLFVEIRVPTAVVSVYDPQTQTVLPAARTPLFSFDASEEWVVLQTFDDGDDVVWRFGWPEPIGPKSDTPPIFEEVVVANLAEEQGQAGKHVVGVTGYGIQSTGFSNCQNAWDAYKRQNGIGDGAPPAGVSAVTAGTLLKFVADTPPEVGDTLDGAEVTCVVTDVEAGAAGCLSDTPGAIERVECLVPTAPEDTSDWFKDMSSCEAMNLSGLDTAGIKDSAGMFAGTTKLVEVTMSPAANPSILPEGVAAADGNLAYRRGAIDALGVSRGSSDNAIYFERLLVEPKVGEIYRDLPISHVCKGIEDIQTPTWFPTYSFNIKKAQIVSAFAPKRTSNWFAQMSGVPLIEGLELIDMSKAIDVSRMFFNCSSLTSLDLSSWDMGQVANASQMFDGCWRLAAIDGLESWNVHSLEDATSMFGRAEALSSLDLSSWRMPNLTSATSMFYQCKALENIGNLSQWDMGQVANASQMFSGCKSLKALEGLSSWKTSALSSTRSMFENCSSLTSLDLSSWDMSSCKTMYWMFGRCTALTSIGDVSGWNTANTSDMTGTFCQCGSLECNCSSWPVGAVTSHSSFNENAYKVLPPSWAA